MIKKTKPDALTDAQIGPALGAEGRAGAQEHHSAPRELSEETRCVRLPALRVRQGADRVLYAFAVNGTGWSDFSAARRAHIVRA